MYKKIKIPKTSLNVNETYEGETIEQKIDRAMNSGSPIKDTAPIVYTKRKDGVHPMYNPRTDRFEIALELTGASAKSMLAEREHFAKKLDNSNKTDTKDPGGQPTEQPK